MPAGHGDARPLCVGNAIDNRMALALRDTCGSLANDDDVYVVVLTGNWDAFCLGTDPKSLTSSETHLPLKAAVYAAELETPVVCGINGNILGQGQLEAQACDIRIAFEDAIFGMPEVALGMLPAAGGTQTLSRLIGGGAALSLMLKRAVASLHMTQGDWVSSTGSWAGQGHSYKTQ